jgi:hypothetical protein
MRFVPFREPADRSLPEIIIPHPGKPVGSHLLPAAGLLHGDDTEGDGGTGLGDSDGVAVADGVADDEGGVADGKKLGLDEAEAVTDGVTETSGEDDTRTGTSTAGGRSVAW